MRFQSAHFRQLLDLRSKGKSAVVAWESFTKQRGPILKNRLLSR